LKKRPNISVVILRRKSESGAVARRKIQNKFHQRGALKISSRQLEWPALGHSRTASLHFMMENIYIKTITMMESI